MKRSLLALLALGVGACAHEEARPQAASCAISEVKWDSEVIDYDKTLTASTLAKLTQIVRSDRDAFRADPSGRQLGSGLNDLNAQIKPGPFVAKSTFTAANQLRQLECAIQRGTFAGRTGDADHIYSEILSDVDNQLKLAKAQ